MHFDQTTFHWNFNLFVKVQWSIKVLVWVMVWHTAGGKQLPKPMMTHIPNTYKSPGLDVLTGYGMKILCQIKKNMDGMFFCNFLFAKDKMSQNRLMGYQCRYLYWCSFCNGFMQLDFVLTYASYSNTSQEIIKTIWTRNLFGYWILGMFTLCKPGLNPAFLWHT